VLVVVVEHLSGLQATTTSTPPPTPTGDPMPTADQDLAHVVAAQSVALRGLAEHLGLTVTGLPELQRSYERAATLDDLARYHDATQAALDQLVGWMQSFAGALAEVVGRPPLVVNVPPPDITIEASIVVPEQDAAVTFKRDQQGRIIGATKTAA
jgi:hypothetical protein